MKCKYCGKEFIKKSNSQKYCSLQCSAAAKKVQDKQNSKERYRALNQEKHLLTATCEYCGEPFIKRHGNQKYCSKECSENKRLEQNADAAMRYYHHTKKQRGGDKVWGLGTGGLGQHKHDDWEVELQKVQNEMKRLRILAK